MKHLIIAIFFLATPAFAAIDQNGNVSVPAQDIVKPYMDRLAQLKADQELILAEMQKKVKETNEIEAKINNILGIQEGPEVDQSIYE